MPERKIWTEEEDRILKLLKEERQIAKWSEISRIMEAEFHIYGRNGKQCRERYHNHLDRNISNSEWTAEEENRLFELQDEVGNKWALISSKLPGRTDNCVKNHFYSKLRKSVRKINKNIHKHLKKEYRDIKAIQTVENRNKTAPNYEFETYQLCRKIINELRKYDDANYKSSDQTEEISNVRSMLEDITLFEPDIKKSIKKVNLKSSNKVEEKEIESLSNKNSSQIVSSTKSVYDEEESEDYSNSDLYSSSSLGQRSFYSNRSQNHLRPQQKFCRSHSIESEAELDSDEDKEDEKILYQSARALKPKHQQWNAYDYKKTEKGLSGSLQLPPQSKLTPARLEKKTLQKQQSGSEQQRKVYLLDFWGQESLAMRVISPQKLTIDEKIEINDQRDELFCRDMVMDTESDCLIKNFKELGLGDIPKLQWDLQI